MKTLTITKDDVLTAIETEPVLTFGTFFRVETCAVCVVGGILRQAGVAGSLINYAGKHVTEFRCSSIDVASKGNWLSALSVTWEYLNWNNRNTPPEDLRWNIWEWAEENIPEDWEYELVVQGGVA